MVQILGIRRELSRKLTCVRGSATKPHLDFGTVFGTAAFQLASSSTVLDEQCPEHCFQLKQNTYDCLDVTRLDCGGLSSGYGPHERRLRFEDHLIAQTEYQEKAVHRYLVTGGERRPRRDWA